MNLKYWVGREVRMYIEIIVLGWRIMHLHVIPSAAYIIAYLIEP